MTEKGEQTFDVHPSPSEALSGIVGFLTHSGGAEPFRFVPASGPAPKPVASVPAAAQVKSAKPWERDWSGGGQASTAKPWERDWSGNAAVSSPAAPTPPADRATMGFEKANAPAQDLEAIHNRMNELRAAGRTKGDPEFDALARQHGEEMSRQQAAGFGITAGGAAAGTAELAALKAVPAAAELLKTPMGRKIALHLLDKGLDAAGIGASGAATYALLKKLGVAN